jgi:peptidoglycan/xylan/chitin deacetylase (PgdA/CDA1 family)
MPGLVLGTVLASLGTAGAGVGGVAYAANWPTSQLFGRTIVAGRNPREIALTFDDGPNPVATPQLLEVLAQHEVRATFFLIGRYVQQQQGLAREIAAAGHSIGNHTLTHPKLSYQSRERIELELSATTRLIEDTVGQPVTLFRPPHGARRPAVIEIARALGMSTVMWNCIVGDWKPLPAATIADRVRRSIRWHRWLGYGTNVVLHDGSHRDPKAGRLATVMATESLLSKLGDAEYVTPERWKAKD